MSLDLLRPPGDRANGLQITLQCRELNHKSLHPSMLQITRISAPKSKAKQNTKISRLIRRLLLLDPPPPSVNACTSSLVTVAATIFFSHLVFLQVVTSCTCLTNGTRATVLYNGHDETTVIFILRGARCRCIDNAPCSLCLEEFFFLRKITHRVTNGV